MDYKITGESLARAKREFRNTRETYNKYPWAVEAAFDAALDSLLVPVEEVEGWVGHVDYYQKKEVKLYWYGGLPFAYWRIFKGDEYITDSANRLTLKEAQAWADKQIAKYEAGKEEEPKPESVSKNAWTLYKNSDVYMTTFLEEGINPEPVKKQFGIGTRLRAANGDELVIIQSPDKMAKAAVNLSRNELWRGENIWYFYYDELKKALLDAGAEVIG